MIHLSYWCTFHRIPTHPKTTAYFIPQGTNIGTIEMAFALSSFPHFYGLV